jgi:hypothetical protein
MKIQFVAALLLGMANLADAHFVWVVPDANGASGKVLMNETLSPTAEVDVAIIGGSKLNVRSADGRETPLILRKGDGFYAVDIPGAGTRIIHGITDLGMMEHGQDKPSVLIYYPKTILGDAFSREEIVAGDTPLELVPLGKPGAVNLELLVHGKPQPDAEITILLPDGTQKTVKTKQDGRTEVFSESGRYGAWARYWEPVGGEREGKKYVETRNYATLVFDAQPAQATASDVAAPPASKPALAITATRFAILPEATSSFGEVVSNGWLYVYGGHIAHTHSYSTESVSGLFERLNLTDGKWEALPGGPGLQGMNLAAYQGEIYRIGGMAPRNKPGEKQAIYSVGDCARFDPATKSWEPLPALPAPRSSHDVAVVGSKLVVVGGWTLDGPAGGKWLDTLEVLDLSAEKLEWKSIKQPFKRRALIAASVDGKMYVIGGFDEHNKIIHDVAIYDPGANQWASGPAVPGGEIDGFAPAACAHNGALYVSVADGSLYRLNASRQEWEKEGIGTPRVAHRIASWGNSILISGGADNGNNSNLIEAIAIAGTMGQ